MLVESGEMVCGAPQCLGLLTVMGSFSWQVGDMGRDPAGGTLLVLWNDGLTGVGKTSYLITNNASIVLGHYA